MRSNCKSRWSATFPAVALAMLVAAVTACAGPAPRPAATQAGAPSAAAPDFPTYGAHFLALQRAGLSGDYTAFAGHLKSDDPQTLIGQLEASFRGAPFDVYTQKANTGATTHRRLIELRGPRGRLYLAIRLDRVSGGWKVTGHTIGRNRNAIEARL